ncbi:hypothetical protein GCM10028799_76750 [Kribbella italica]
MLITVASKTTIKVAVVIAASANHFDLLLVSEAISGKVIDLFSFIGLGTPSLCRAMATVAKNVAISATLRASGLDDPLPERCAHGHLAVHTSG